MVKAVPYCQKPQFLGGSDSAPHLSVADVVSGGRRLAYLTAAVFASSMRIEFEPIEQSPEKVDSLIFYSYAEVGNHLLFALCECSLTHEVQIGSRRQLNFGPVKRVDSYVIENPSLKEREQMEKDFERYHAARERQGNPLGIGELIAFARRTQTGSAAV